MNDFAEQMLKNVIFKVYNHEGYCNVGLMLYNRPQNISYRVTTYDNGERITYGSKIFATDEERTQSETINSERIVNILRQKYTNNFINTLQIEGGDGGENVQPASMADEIEEPVESL